MGQQLPGRVEFCSSETSDTILQIVLVTKQVVELHQVIEEKKTTKLVRTTNVDAVWAIFYVCFYFAFHILSEKLEKFDHSSLFHALKPY